MFRYQVKSRLQKPRFTSPYTTSPRKHSSHVCIQRARVWYNTSPLRFFAWAITLWRDTTVDTFIEARDWYLVAAVLYDISLPPTNRPPATDPLPNVRYTHQHCIFLGIFLMELLCSAIYPRFDQFRSMFYFLFASRRLNQITMPQRYSVYEKWCIATVISQTFLLNGWLEMCVFVCVRVVFMFWYCIKKTYSHGKEWMWSNGLKLMTSEDDVCWMPIRVGLWLCAVRLFG